MQIVIFSTATCPYCHELKDYLTAKNLQFTEKFIDSSEDAKSEMLNFSKGFLGVPYSVITKDDGTIETVVGFDKGKLNSVTGIE